ncbi:MAG: SH3 domain-containing protein [Devosia sp.]
MPRIPIGCLGWIGLAILGAFVIGIFSDDDDEPAQRQVATTEWSSEVGKTAPATPLLSVPRYEGFQPRTLYVTATTLNVRERPEGSAAVLLAASKGTSVMAVGAVVGWYEVQLNDGSTGWMSAQYLADQPEIVADTAPVHEFVEPQQAYDKAAVVRAIIAISRQSYSGSCACPEDRDRGGRRCGARSAYVKPRGQSPLCYPSDVSQRMIDDFLARQ